MFSLERLKYTKHEMKNNTWQFVPIFCIYICDSFHLYHRATHWCVTTLTYHDSGHSQQQGSDEGWGANRQTQRQVGERRLGRQQGHLCMTRETTALHTCYLPRRSINIHFATLIPNLINDVKAMTQQSSGAATASACQFLFSGEDLISLVLSFLSWGTTLRETILRL